MEVRKNRLFLGGVDATRLVGEYSSPLYVYEEEVIRKRARELRSAIGSERKVIKYSCKANTNIEILKIIKEEGIGIDAVSPGEIHAAIAAGFRPEEILFTASNVSPEEIDFAVARGVLVNVDSISGLRTVGRRHQGGDVCVRINPDVGAGHHGHVITGGPESKFGIEYDRVDEITRTASSFGLRIRGVHQHIGSGILDAGTFIMAMRVLLDVAKRFDDLDFVDFGGGIGVPYRKDEKRVDVALLGEKITKEYERFCNEYGKTPTLVIEPGRYFVAESGFLLATVMTVKEGHNHRFVGLDTGFNHLVRPAFYGSYHEILHSSNVGENGDGRDFVLQTIAGNLCESGDTFTRDENGIVDRLLPPFKEGDVACICNAGAYGYSMASQYNSRPRPAEVLVSNGESRLIRRRETLDDMFISRIGT
ncbi:MAG: diaminopimelate decarboxylase [Spirochaetes bacterium]|nr:diaminopimelate decarboxylase [Spirochaetota bacterium]